MRLRCEAVVQDAGRYSAFFDSLEAPGVVRFSADTSLVLSGIEGVCPFVQLGTYEIEFRQVADGSSESNDSDG